jgi:hypothetical protein
VDDQQAWKMGLMQLGTSRLKVRVTGLPAESSAGGASGVFTSGGKGGGSGNGAGVAPVGLVAGIPEVAVCAKTKFANSRINNGLNVCRAITHPPVEHSNAAWDKIDNTKTTAAPQ